MDAASLKTEIKELIVKELNLEGRDPASIQDDAPLFGGGGGGGAGGLGLDSLDALQLAMSVEERYGVRIPEWDQARVIFASVSSLAHHVASASKGAG
jgi:acyl carrier protein